VTRAADASPHLAGHAHRAPARKSRPVPALLMKRPAREPENA